MRVTRKGQVTIPKHMREGIGIEEGSLVEFELAGDVVILRKSQPGTSEESIRRRYQQAMRQLERLRGTATSGLTTEEIMELTRGPFDDLDAR